MALKMGVGGTRALAHSIRIIMMMIIRRTMMIMCFVGSLGYLRSSRLGPQ